MDTSDQSNGILETRGSNVRERHAPLRTFLFLALLGSSILFLSLITMFIVWVNYHPPIDSFELPKAFIISTIVLLLSSYLVTLTSRYFASDNVKSLLFVLLSTLVLACVFAYLQITGWTEMYRCGHYFNGFAGITFLYILTGLHFAHLTGGVVYLVYLNLNLFNIWQDPVRELLFFSDPFQKARFDLFSIYWHFVDGLWLFLFFTFLFTF